MPREQPPEPKKSDVPSWFMTYSDVITLLMTFFILLLTFATTEPERFEKIQVAMFGGSGSTGIAGEQPLAIEKDSWTLRIRPPSARMCLDGSEMPPMNNNPETGSADESLAGLDETEEVERSNRFSIELDMSALISSDGDVHSIGKQFAKMFSIHMYQLPIHVTFEAPNEDSLNRSVRFANFIFREFKIKPGQMGVRLINRSSNKTRVVIEHFLFEQQQARR